MVKHDMSSDVRPIVHIGHMKTASTWMQKYIFNNSQIGLYSPWKHQDIVDRFVIVDPYSFKKTEVTGYFEKHFMLAQRQSLLPVISEERLAGSPDSGGADAELIGDRLYKTFPTARIIIVIREQKSMIYSWYKQYVRMGGGHKLKDYLNPPTRSMLRIPYFNPAFYKYHKQIEHYMNLFGEENVLVVPFEELRLNKHQFVDNLIGFCGGIAVDDYSWKSENTSFSAASVEIKRILNRFLLRTPLNLGGLTELRKAYERVDYIARGVNKLAPRFLSKEIDRHALEYIQKYVGDLYVESNRSTSQLIGIDLGKLGYPT